MISLRPHTALLLCLALLCGCESQGTIKPAEALDERTGMTVGSLEKPLELVQSAQFAVTPDRRLSFAYLGPVEWDNMGAISYALWVHLAPAADWQFDDIRGPGTVRLSLDRDSVPLQVVDAPPLARGPYQPVASWGQTAYFEIDLATLKSMASSGRIELDFKAGGSRVRFIAAPDARDTLMRYIRARGY